MPDIGSSREVRWLGGQSIPMEFGDDSGLAPEQVMGWADAASDIYRLAKVVMEMITGKRLSELLPEASRDLPKRVWKFLAHIAAGAFARIKGSDKHDVGI